MRELPVSRADLSGLKRAIFDDAASDWWGLWEVAGLARARFPHLNPEKQSVVAEVAVRELIQAGLVTELCRGTWVGQERDPVPVADYEPVLSDPQSWTASPDPIFWIAADEPPDSATRESILHSL